MNVVIPCAGAGARFAAAGYQQSKPLIEVRGKPMLAWALDMIPPDWNVVLVGRGATDIVRIDECARAHHAGDVQTVILPGPTEGAACTALVGAIGLPPDEPVAVMNCDQYVRPVEPLDKLQAFAEREQLDGYILTFRATDPKWSFVATDENGFVTRVAEKDPISDEATVGFYAFRRARDLVWACADVIAKNDRTRGEFYLCPVYNHCIASGARIAAVPVAAMHGLGTPDDVLAFERAAVL